MPLPEVTQHGPGRDREPGLILNINPRAAASLQGTHTTPSAFYLVGPMGTVEKLQGQVEVESGHVEDEGRGNIPSDRYPAPLFPGMHLFRGDLWERSIEPCAFLPISPDSWPSPPLLLAEGGVFVVVFVVFLA